MGKYISQTWPLESKLGIIFLKIALLKPRNFARKFMPFMGIFGGLATALCQDGSYCISDCYFDRTLCVSDTMQAYTGWEKTCKSPLEPQSSQWFCGD